jgi:O-antigen/teichoic acid export membrane protein
LITFVVLGITWKYIREQVGARLLCAIDYRRAWEFIKRGRYAFGGALMLYFYNQFDVLLVSYFTDAAQAGYFRAANTFTSPMALLVSVSDAIIFPRLAVMHKEAPAQFLRNSSRLAGLYALVAVPAAVVAVPVCSVMVTLLFGNKYAPAIVPAQFLIISSCISVVCGPFRWGLMAANRDGAFFLNSSFVAVIAVGLNLALAPHLGASGAALARLLSQSVLMVSSGVLCYRFFKR